MLNFEKTAFASEAFDLVVGATGLNQIDAVKAHSEFQWN